MCFQHIKSKTFQDKAWSNPAIQTWWVSSYLVEVILFIVLFPVMRSEPASFVRSPQSSLLTSNSLWELWLTFDIFPLRSVPDRRIWIVPEYQPLCIAVGNIKRLDRALTSRLVSNVSWSWILEQGSLNLQTCHSIYLGVPFNLVASFIIYLRSPMMAPWGLNKTSGPCWRLKPNRSAPCRCLLKRWMRTTWVGWFGPLIPLVGRGKVWLAKRHLKFNSFQVGQVWIGL